MLSRRIASDFITCQAAETAGLARIRLTTSRSLSGTKPLSGRREKVRSRTSATSCDNYIHYYSPCRSLSEKTSKCNGILMFSLFSHAKTHVSSRNQALFKRSLTKCIRGSLISIISCCSWKTFSTNRTAFVLLFPCLDLKLAMKPYWRK